MASSDDEVAIPLPGSWSDSEDGEPRKTGGYSAGPSSQAMAMLAAAPGHDHCQRHLAEGASAASLAAFATWPAAPGTEAEVFDCRDAQFSPEDFLHRCAGLGRPALVHGVPQQDAWPALEKWKSQDTFLEHYGQQHVQVTEMAAYHGLGKPMRVELTLEEYVGYARENQVDWPFYVWERNFTGDRQALLQDFEIPKMMGEDLYDLSPEVREFLPLSCHLFVLVGGHRTGSNMHKDPKWSSAWNTLLCGRKRWVMFPPDVPAESIGAMAGDAYKDGGPPAYWWLDHYPHLAAKKLGMVDILQCPGDTIFVPSGWWHCTLNLPDTPEDVTIACTRNIFPAETLDFVFPQMKASDPAFAQAFLEILKQKRPELLRFLPAELLLVHPKPSVVGDDPSWRLERVPFSRLSLASCRRDYIRCGRPLIIEGLGPHLLSQESCHLSRDFLSRHFGEKMVAVFRNFREPKLRDAEDQMELMRLSEAIGALQRGGSEGLYLYDVSLPLKLPGLLEHVKLPRYFTHCYLQQTMRPHCFSKSWPTLFIGAKDSQARLHVDQWHSHFWMHLTSGVGNWRAPKKWARAEKAEDWRKKELERLNCTKYHYLKFVERQKVERRMKTCKKQLSVALEKGQEEEAETLRRTLRQHLADHEYIRHYPKHLPYNALFPATDSEASQKRREEIRKMIREQLEKEGVPSALPDVLADEATPATPKAKSSDQGAKKVATSTELVEEKPKKGKKRKNADVQQVKVEEAEPSAPKASKKRKSAQEDEGLKGQTAELPPTVKKSKVPKKKVKLPELPAAEGLQPKEEIPSVSKKSKATKKKGRVLKEE